MNNKSNISLAEFTNMYDSENAIVLLEGKRDVLENERAKLTKLGRLLCEQTKKMVFRSGNAAGADYYFSLGVSSVDNTRMQVITPYAGHRKKLNQAYDTISLDEINLASEPDVIYQSKGNKKTEKLIDQYVSGDKNRNSIKAAYIIRDTIKVLGTADIKPATFGIFYDDLQNPNSGGTGHTMNVCEQNGVAIINQEIWFSWLEE